MRYGDICRECKDTTSGLWLDSDDCETNRRKAYNITTRISPSSAGPSSRNTSNFDFGSGHQAQDHSKGCKYNRSSRSTRDNSTDDVSTNRRPEPEASTNRHPEDKRDKKLQELTAIVEKLASVIECMSKSQKSEPVEFRPKSRSPRRRRRNSRNDSRTPRKGRRRSKSRRDSRGRSLLPRKSPLKKKRSGSPKKSPASRSPVKNILQGTAAYHLVRTHHPSLRDQ